MPRIVAAIVLVAVLAVGGGIIATTAYQAGVSSAVTTTMGTTATGTVVAPVVVPAYGVGWWHPFGFIGGFFGFLFFLFFLFLVFGLIRAIVWGGRGRRGWYGNARGARRPRRRPGALGVPRARHVRGVAPGGTRRGAEPRRRGSAGGSADRPHLGRLTHVPARTRAPGHRPGAHPST